MPTLTKAVAVLRRTGDKLTVEHCGDDNQSPVPIKRISMIDRSLNYGRHHIRKFLASANYSSALDLGAGQGDDLLSARAINPDAELHAIELFHAHHQSLTDQGIKVHALDIERDRFPFADESKDIVIANQILEHTKEIFWIFHEVSRILPVGGSFIIGVPNLASLHNRVLLMLGQQPTTMRSLSAHIRGYTRADLLNLMEGCFPGGYKLKNFGGSNFYPFPPIVARALAHLAPSMAVGIFLRLEKQKTYRNEFVNFPTQAQLETNFYTGPLKT